MAWIERRAEVGWEASLARGRGSVPGGSGAHFELPVTWASRLEHSDGRTSPEEPIAAAPAACHAMALSNVLTDAGSSERLQFAAVVAAELGDEGVRVVATDLAVQARRPGIDTRACARHAQAAERACPVSNALRGNLEIRVHPSLD